MIFVLALVAGLASGSGRAQETSLTQEERAKLDTFEGAAFATEDPVEPIVSVKGRPVDTVEGRMARVRGVVTVRDNE